VNFVTVEFMGERLRS